MNTPQLQPLTKEHLLKILEYKAGGNLPDEAYFTNVSAGQVWLAAQWLKEEVKGCIIEPSEREIINDVLESIDEAFGACRPDAEKKQ